MESESTCTANIGAEAPTNPFTSTWLVDGLFKRGELTQLTGERFAGKRRLLAYLLAQMLASPAGGPALRCAVDDRPLTHR